MKSNIPKQIASLGIIILVSIIVGVVFPNEAHCLDFGQGFPNSAKPSLNSLPHQEMKLYFDSYITDYSKVIGTILIATLLCLLLFLLSFFFAISNKKEYEKASEYECGFEPFDAAVRQPFDVHFYIVGILFLIFDVEIAVLFPWTVGLDLVGGRGIWNMIIFLLILTIGFVYEWQRGALSWPQKTIDIST